MTDAFLRAVGWAPVLEAVAKCRLVAEGHMAAAECETTPERWREINRCQAEVASRCADYLESALPKWVKR